VTVLGASVNDNFKVIHRNYPNIIYPQNTGDYLKTLTLRHNYE